MRVEYFQDPESQTPPVLLTYGDDADDAKLLRQTAEALAKGDSHNEVRVDLLPGFEGVDGCSLVASVGTLDLGVEPIGGSDRAFRCVLRHVTWTHVAGLLEPFERPSPEAAVAEGLRRGLWFQYLSEDGSVEWIVSSGRGW